MRVIIQRVSEASVYINKGLKSEIKQGLLILLGIEGEDSHEDIDWLTGKISRLRIFNDAEGLMNRSLQDIGGEALVISQFTLHASTKKGNRPSYIRAAKPEFAIPLYKKFIENLEEKLGQAVGSGEFGADMQIKLINDGPVSIFIDTKAKE